VVLVADVAGRLLASSSLILHYSLGGARCSYCRPYSFFGF